MRKGSNRVTPVGGNKTFFIASIRMWLTVYVLVKNLAKFVDLYFYTISRPTCSFWQPLGVHWEFWNSLGFHWDNSVEIPVKFPAEIPLEFCGIPVRCLGSQWDSRHFLPVKSQWNSQLGLCWDHMWDLPESHLGFPSFYPGGIPADSSGMPVGISPESHLGSQLNFQNLWGCYS